MIPFRASIRPRYPIVLLGVLAGIAALVWTMSPRPSSAPVAAQTPSSLSGLHVAGNTLLNGAGQVVRLHGVNRSGTEYACIQGWGIFDGPSDAASVQAIASWHTNAVRVPLNEDCWLDVNGAPAAYSGGNYQTAIINYVDLLNSYGLAAILDLHWNAPGTQQATGQQPMPDQDHAPAFWQSVATTFKGNSSVVFDLYNEPYPDNNQISTAAWQCWLNGGTCSGVSYPAAGMQELVNTVRGTGARNVVLLGGITYADTLDQWLTYKPSDPTGNLGASWHIYNNQYCSASSCWTSQVAPVAAAVPLTALEIGENDCTANFITPLMNWLDAQGAGYLAWAWDTYSCTSFPSIISDYGGTPTQTYGQGYQAHLANLASSPSPSPSPSTSPTPTPSRSPSPSPSPSPSTSPSPAPGFSIAASPSSLAVRANRSGSYTVTLTASGGFSSPVTLSVSGLPAGATGSFGSSMVTPTPGGATTPLTIRAGSTQGSFPLTITGSAGGVTQSARATLVIKK